MHPRSACVFSPGRVAALARLGAAQPTFQYGRLSPSCGPLRQHTARLQSPFLPISCQTLFSGASPHPRLIHTSAVRLEAGRKPSEDDDFHDVSSTAAALAYGSLRKRGTIRNLRLQPKPKSPSQKENEDKNAETSDDAWTREALAQRGGPLSNPNTSTNTTAVGDASPQSPGSSTTTTQPGNADPAPPPQPDRAEDLLKLRSLEQADKGAPRDSSASSTSDGNEPQMIIDLPPPDKRAEGAQPSSASASAASSGANETPSTQDNSASSESFPGEGWAEYLRDSRQGLTPIKHMVDTHAFAQRLVKSGWAGEGMDQKKQDKVALILTEGVESMLVDRLNQSRQGYISSVDVEYQSYVFRLALNEVKTELEVRARNDGAALRSMTQVLQREVDRLSQKAREDVDTMQHAIRVAMHEAKTEVKGQQNDQEQAVQDLKHKLTIVVSTLKTGLEHSLKWDLSRRAFLLLFGQICFFFTVFKLLALFSKKDKDKNGPPSPGSKHAGPGHATNAGNRPQSAEDIGLVPHYEVQGPLTT